MLWCSWNVTVSLIAIITSLFFFVKFALNMCGKYLCWHNGGPSDLKCVSCTQSTSLLWANAVFHSEALLAGWLRPMAFRDSTVKNIVLSNIVCKVLMRTYN